MKGLSGLKILFFYRLFPAICEYGHPEATEKKKPTTPLSSSGARLQRVPNATNKMLDQRLDYLHKNPVEQGIVFRAEDYCYSSAVDYIGETGLFKIEKID